MVPIITIIYFFIARYARAPIPMTPTATAPTIRPVFSPSDIATCIGCCCC